MIKPVLHERMLIPRDGNGEMDMVMKMVMDMDVDGHGYGHGYGGGLSIYKHICDIDICHGQNKEHGYYNVPNCIYLRYSGPGMKRTTSFSCLISSF